MKQNTGPLISFINDYKLGRQNGYICFKASIHFNAKLAWFKFVSPVHIITISLKKLDVIYLLNPDIDAKKIKTMFTNNERFFYSPTKRFEIRGKSKYYGPYSLFIIPITNHCDEEIIGELHAKRYN